MVFKLSFKILYLEPRRNGQIPGKEESVSNHTRRNRHSLQGIYCKRIGSSAFSFLHWLRCSVRCLHPISEGQGFRSWLYSNSWLPANVQSCRQHSKYSSHQVLSIHKGDLGGIYDSWLYPGPVSAVLVTWGVNKKM